MPKSENYLRLPIVCAETFTSQQDKYRYLEILLKPQHGVCFVSNSDTHETLVLAFSGTTSMQFLQKKIIDFLKNMQKSENIHVQISGFVRDQYLQNLAMFFMISNVFLPNIKMNLGQKEVYFDLQNRCLAKKDISKSNLIQLDSSSAQQCVDDNKPQYFSAGNSKMKTTQLKDSAELIERVNANQVLTCIDLPINAWGIFSAKDYVFAKIAAGLLVIQVSNVSFDKEFLCMLCDVNTSCAAVKQIIDDFINKDATYTAEDFVVRMRYLAVETNEKIRKFLAQYYTTRYMALEINPLEHSNSEFGALMCSIISTRIFYKEGLTFIEPRAEEEVELFRQSQEYINSATRITKKSLVEMQVQLTNASEYIDEAVYSRLLEQEEPYFSEINNSDNLVPYWIKNVVDHNTYVLATQASHISKETGKASCVTDPLGMLKLLLESKVKPIRPIKPTAIYAIDAFGSTPLHYFCSELRKLSKKISLLSPENEGDLQIEDARKFLQLKLMTLMLLIFGKADLVNDKNNAALQRLSEPRLQSFKNSCEQYLAQINAVSADPLDFNARDNFYLKKLLHLVFLSLQVRDVNQLLKLHEEIDALMDPECVHFLTVYPLSLDVFSKEIAKTQNLGFVLPKDHLTCVVSHENRPEVFTVSFYIHLFQGKLFQILDSFLQEHLAHEPPDAVTIRLILHNYAEPYHEDFVQKFVERYQSKAKTTVTCMSSQTKLVIYNLDRKQILYPEKSANMNVLTHGVYLKAYKEYFTPQLPLIYFNQQILVWEKFMSDDKVGELEAKIRVFTSDLYEKGLSGILMQHWNLADRLTSEFNSLIAYMSSDDLQIDILLLKLVSLPINPITPIQGKNGNTLLHYACTNLMQSYYPEQDNTKNRNVFINKLIVATLVMFTRSDLSDELAHNALDSIDTRGFCLSNMLDLSEFKNNFKNHLSHPGFKECRRNNFIFSLFVIYTMAYEWQKLTADSSPDDFKALHANVANILSHMDMIAEGNELDVKKIQKKSHRLD